MSPFDKNFYLLECFLKKNNNLLPPFGHPLYRIIYRFKKNKASLSNYQLSMLNEIDFFNLKTAPSKQDKVWLEKYNQLKDHIKKFGKPPGQIRTSRFPDRYVNGKWKTKEEQELHSLSIWVLSQKQHYKKKKISEERINLLSEIEFYFNKKQKFPFTIKKHEEMLNEIIAENMSNVSESKYYNTIWSWIKRTNQKLENFDEHSVKSFKNFEKKFTAIEKKSERNWMKNFKRFKEFYNHNRALPIANAAKWSKSYNKWSEEFKIAIWLRVQATTFRKGKLSEKRTNLLKDFYPDFGQRRRSVRVSWEERCKMFKSFTDTYGREPKQNTGDRKEDIEEDRLAMWALRNRSFYHKTHASGADLSKKQMKMLEEINFNFDFLSYQ
tara:strand:+ start:193 stop:1335 length:1143 start_codon:yes stop_codon:yes gene_type:complete